MERDQKKRSRAVDGGSGGGGQRKKERETKGKGKDAVVVPPPTEDEVDEFIAILRRMREAAKYFEIKGNGNGNGGVGKLLDPSREVVVDDERVSMKKRSDVALLDLNTVPDEGE